MFDYPSLPFVIYLSCGVPITHSRIQSSLHPPLLQLAFSDPFGLHLRLLHLSAAVCFGLFVLTLLSEWWAGYLALLAASYGITFVLLRERQFFV